VAVSRPRAHRASTVRGPLVAAGSIATATAVLALRDPHAAGSYGVCPFHAVTGLWCPTCGGLRSTYDLIHLHLAAAWGENALWVVAAPLLVVGWIVVQVRRARGLPVGRVPAWAQVAGLAVVLAFGVLRNLPPFGSLAP
jgi:hypothetical protein